METIPKVHLPLLSKISVLEVTMRDGNYEYLFKTSTGTFTYMVLEVTMRDGNLPEKITVLLILSSFRSDYEGWKLLSKYFFFSLIKSYVLEVTMRDGNRNNPFYNFTFQHTYRFRSDYEGWKPYQQCKLSQSFERSCFRSDYEGWKRKIFQPEFDCC